jgi:Flp pilus assembly protein TadG
MSSGLTKPHGISRIFGPNPLQKGKVVRRIFRYWRNEAGNVAMMFGLAIVPILGLAGGAVDLSRRASVEGQLQAAADVAALAAARSIQSGQHSSDDDWAERRAAAAAAGARMFETNFAARVEGIAPDPDVDVDEFKVSVAADVDVPTSLLTVLGIRSFKAKAFAEVVIPSAVEIEIALVLDYSGSMQENDKYVRMTSAAQAFIDKIAAERRTTTKVGIVPFSEYVLATVRGRDVRGTPLADSGDSVTACLLNRDHPYSTSGETPYPAVEASRWPALATGDAACQPYVTGSLNLFDLSDDFTGLSNALSDMRPTGLTNIALATEMGWHLLSPEEPFDTAGSPTSDRPLMKVVILLTDGMQTVEAMGPSGDVSVAAANEGTLELCNNMEAAGLRVFTIAYDLDDPAARTLLTECASANGAFREANTTDIAEIFEDIYQQIVESVWLSG